MVKYDRVLITGSRLCIPNIKDLKKKIIKETHCSAYTMYLSITKICLILRDRY